MKRFLTWLIMIPFALVVIVFSAVNRELVTLDLWPLPNEITVPVFTLVLAVFIVGFLWCLQEVPDVMRAMHNGGLTRPSANCVPSATNSMIASGNSAMHSATMRLHPNCRSRPTVANAVTGRLLCF